MKYSDFCNQFNIAPTIKRPGIDDYLILKSDNDLGSCDLPGFFYAKI